MKRVLTPVVPALAAAMTPASPGGALSMTFAFAEGVFNTGNDDLTVTA